MEMFGVDSMEELEKMLNPHKKQDEQEEAPTEDLSDVDFIASEEFAGPREGYYFRKDVQGTGYYKEKEAASKQQPETEAVPEKEPELDMDGDLSKLRIKQLKRIITKADMDYSTLM